MDVVATKSPTRVEVEDWLEAVRSDLRRIASVIEPLLQEQERLRDREALLAKLLQSLSIDQPGQSARPELAPPAPRSDGSVLEYVREGVVQVLRDSNGGPMHINDIHAKFLTKGFRVPGAGRPANLTAHLGRCPGIVSPRRGFYAIGEAQAEAAPRRRRRRKRRG